MAHDWTEPNVCIDENLTVTVDGRLQLAKWSVPRLVQDVMVKSSSDGKFSKPQVVLPGVLMMDQQIVWKNDSPLPASLLISVTRGTRSWVTSNPNAIQIRDRWTRTVDRQPDMPVVTSISNGRTGSAIDLGTNSVAEPNKGKHWLWMGAHDSDEWYPQLIDPAATFRIWYQCYYWTPPPWSDNANQNAPQHQVESRWTRIRLWAFPQQGSLVKG